MSIQKKDKNFMHEYTEERQKFYAILKKFIQTDNKEKNILFLMVNLE